jgi:hypothetical protein
MSETPDANAVVSVEQDGRTLSGVGATTAELEAVMERHAPEEKEAPAELPAPSPQDTQPAPTEPEKPKTRGQARFAELAAQRDAEKTKREAAEKERDELKARLSQPPVVQTPPAHQTQPAAPSRPEPIPQTPPAKRPSIDQFATWDEYEDARDAWVKQQTIQELNLDARIRQTLDSERSQQSFLTQVEQTRIAARKVYRDFDQVISTGPGSQVMMPREKIEAIIAAPNSEHLQYLIAKDGALAQRLASASPINFGMELAKLAPASQLPANGGTAHQPPPAPYTPVGAGTPTTVTPSSELVDKGYDFDKSGYRARRAAERGVKPRY